MPSPFVRGQNYTRRQVLDVTGGTEQAGIFYPEFGPSIVAVDAVYRAGANGYTNQWLEPSVFKYAGQGRTGHQTLTGANLRLLQHAEEGRDLYVFTQVRRRGPLRFDGEMVVEDCQPEPVNRNGGQELVYFFTMRRVEAIVEAVDGLMDEEQGDNLPFDERRRRAYAAAHIPADDAERRPRNIYRRAYEVSSYVLERARGVCEGGGEPAPFFRPDNRPYLEPHHIDKVGDGGPDSPINVIALCPNCHRRVHHGQNRVAQNAEYRRIVAAKEAELD